MKIGYVAPLVLAACGRAALAPPQPGERVEVPEQPAQTQPLPTFAAEESPPPPIDAPLHDDDDTPAPLSGAWSATFNHLNKYVVAGQNMQIARTAYRDASAAVFESDGGLPTAQEFEKANAALELLNRRYAAVYYAPDATDAQRVDTLEEASNLLLQWAHRLDAVGLDKLPKSFRTNRSIALTFEDTIHGPAKRWRGEGISLAQTCVTRAKANNVTSYASRSCADLVKSNAHLASPPHAKTQPECACVPGDPLCSASMSGWCKPQNH